MVDTIVSRRAALALAAGAAFAVPAAASAGPARPPLLANYLDAWRRRDLDAILACMHPDLHFKGPNVETRGRDEYRVSTVRFLGLLERVEDRASFAGEGGAMIAWSFACRAPIGTSATAELLRFRDGLIGESEIFFDVRPFEAFARGRAAAGK